MKVIVWRTTTVNWHRFSTLTMLPNTDYCWLEHHCRYVFCQNTTGVFKPPAHIFFNKVFFLVQNCDYFWLNLHAFLVLLSFWQSKNLPITKAALHTLSHHREQDVAVFFLDRIYSMISFLHHPLPLSLPPSLPPSLLVLCLIVECTCKVLTRTN